MFIFPQSIKPKKKATLFPQFIKPVYKHKGSTCEKDIGLTIYSVGPNPKSLRVKENWLSNTYTHRHVYNYFQC